MDVPERTSKLHGPPVKAPMRFTPGPSTSGLRMSLVRGKEASVLLREEGSSSGPREEKEATWGASEAKSGARVMEAEGLGGRGRRREWEERRRGG